MTIWVVKEENIQEKEAKVEEAEIITSLTREDKVVNTDKEMTIRIGTDNNSIEEGTLKKDIKKETTMLSITTPTTDTRREMNQEVAMTIIIRVKDTREKTTEEEMTTIGEEVMTSLRIEVKETKIEMITIKKEEEVTEDTTEVAVEEGVMEKDIKEEGTEDTEVLGAEAEE